MWKICVAIISIISIKVQGGFGANINPIKHVEEIPEHHLQKDLNDFIDLVPLDDIKNLTIYYYTHDENMRKSYEFLTGENYTAIKNELFGLYEFKMLNDFFNESGVKFDNLLKRLEQFSLPLDEVRAIKGKITRKFPRIKILMKF